MKAEPGTALYQMRRNGLSYKHKKGKAIKAKETRQIRKINNPDNICFRCKEPLDNKVHHYYCSKCWAVMQLRMAAHR